MRQNFKQGASTAIVMAAILSLPACATNAPLLRGGDPIVAAVDALAPDNAPDDPVPGVDYGMIGPDGSFVHPERTPYTHEPHPFPGEMTEWDTGEYAHNMQVEAYYPIIVEPFHTWQNIVDFDGRRYLYQYVRRSLKVYDITDPRDLKVIHEQGQPWTGQGQQVEIDPMPPGEMMGAASIQWDAERQKYVMVQAYEIRRFGLLHDKRNEPDKVVQIRQADHLKGFKVYEMNGPLPKDWHLLAQRTTDRANPDAPVGEQQGSGVRDIPAWFGGRYMFVAAAPDKMHALTEYPNDLYSAGYQAWDMSDPAKPRFLDQLSVKGQILSNPEHEAAYKANPRAGNRTSWFGARMAPFIPKPIEKGGKYGYAAMGGLGFFVLDLSDPANMRVVGHLDFPESIAGTEGDNIDVTQVESTGIVYFSGYPLNEDCYEPYKHITAIDVSDPANPRVVARLPRPTAPPNAPFADFCQRRGSFGPKRSGYYTQPGKARPGILPYAFYNAGVQIFDVSDPENTRIAAYFVPQFKPDAVPEYAMGNLTHSIYVEYDRNLLWMFTNHGIYLLSSEKVLGEPSFAPPKKPWPARD
jgi:hypothetical protein